MATIAEIKHIEIEMNMPKVAERRQGPAMLRTSHAGLGFIFRHEALRGVSGHLHWPGGASGVTLGPGYDMKLRERSVIVSDMLRLGIEAAVAERIAAGAKLVGPAAEDFAGDNEDLVALTELQETRLLSMTVPPYEGVVRRNVRIGLMQHEFDALVSFVYNPGGSFLPIAQAINSGQVLQAMRQIQTRVSSGHRKSAGLRRRRIDEVQLFLHGAYRQHVRLHH